MESKHVFTRNADGGLDATANTKAAVARTFRANPGTLSRPIVDAAAADLIREAKDLMFTSGKSYEECSTHLISKNPWYALALAPIGDEKADRALGIEIVGEES